MPVAAFNADTFRDLLPLYYRRLFPYKQFFEWVTYGDETHKRFRNREFSFTLEDDIYIRYQSFENVKEMEFEIKKRNPHKIDIGAIFDMQPKHHKRGPLIPLEKELVFDIDMTDYDDVRSCCQGADVCTKCWKFMAIACKILDKALREDFGYTHLLWVFSGRRGIHCWVCDEEARSLDNAERAAVAGFLQNDPTRYQHAKRDKFHPSLRRALGIIENEFVETLMVEQDALGTNEKVGNLVDSLPQELSKDLLVKLVALATSIDRWKYVVNHIEEYRQSAAGKGMHLFAVEELMLRFAYPRLDINVSTGLNHLLKAPFCVHPKSGKVCVPFNPKTVDKFDPSAIPTLSQLVEEVRDFDEKEKVFAAGLGKAAAKREVETPSEAKTEVEMRPEIKQEMEEMQTEQEADEGDEKMETSVAETVKSEEDGSGPMDEVKPKTEPDASAEESFVCFEASFEAKTLPSEREAAEDAAICSSVVVRDYKKTSMYKGILVFESFLRKLKVARSQPSGDLED